VRRTCNGRELRQRRRRRCIHRCRVLIHTHHTPPQEHHPDDEQDEDFLHLHMCLLERYRASPHQQSINTALMLAGLLSISIPLVVEGVHFVVRLRRRKGKMVNAGGFAFSIASSIHSVSISCPSCPSLSSPIDQDTTSLQTHTQKVYRVVLTGGPCSGKTSSLAHVRAACKQAGYDCLVVPEVPTILMEGGATYPGFEGGHRLIAFEAALIRLQLQMEESFLTIARSLGKPTIMLMDRGSVDICAYLMPKDWLATLSALGGLTTADLLLRYHQVIHLVTAADGAPSFYTLR